MIFLDYNASKLILFSKRQKNNGEEPVLSIIGLCVFMVCLTSAEACRQNRVPQQSCGCTSSSCSRGRA